jgi:hypothetical protein
MTRVNPAIAPSATLLMRTVVPALCLADGSCFAHACSWAAFDAGGDVNLGDLVELLGAYGNTCD